MKILEQIKTPALLLDAVKCRNNIDFMASKALNESVTFRPHFKTHQSARVGEWFRERGVSKITVSSVSMAKYFAEHGWKDILIALPVNLHELQEVNDLARRIKLGLLVDSREAVGAIEQGIQNPVLAWIKIDAGLHRTGIPAEHTDRLIDLARAIKASRSIRLKGILTHAGQTYQGSSREERVEKYLSSIATMHRLRSELAAAGIEGMAISVGDTPGCTLSPTLGDVGEIRPGNFVFYDSQMLNKGVCDWSKIAMVMVCPIVSLQPERDEVVVYGGAIHFSKDTLQDGEVTHHGYVVALNEDGSWGEPMPGFYLARMSQEHGVIRMSREAMQHYKIGDWIGVIPAHVCLTVSAMRRYLTLDGEWIPAFEDCDA